MNKNDPYDIKLWLFVLLAVVFTIVLCSSLESWAQGL